MSISYTRSSGFARESAFTIKPVPAGAGSSRSALALQAGLPIGMLSEWKLTGIRQGHAGRHQQDCIRVWPASSCWQAACWLQSLRVQRFVVEIEKSTQTMYVTVNGVTRHQWPVSTGRGRFGTPNGVFRPQRLERRWFSRRYYNSPMPYAVFFHKGYAIHGTTELSRLGGPGVAWLRAAASAQRGDAVLARAGFWPRDEHGSRSTASSRADPRSSDRKASLTLRRVGENSCARPMPCAIGVAAA